MHSNRHSGGPRPNLLVRIFRGLVFIALLPAILVAGVILLPVFVIARLVGLGPRGHGCRGRRAGTDVPGAPSDSGDEGDTPSAI